MRRIFSLCRQNHKTGKLTEPTVMELLK